MGFASNLSPERGNEPHGQERGHESGARERGRADYPLPAGSCALAHLSFSSHQPAPTGMAGAAGLPKREMV
jgi:hypothetical protein